MANIFNLKKHKQCKIEYQLLLPADPSEERFGQTIGQKSEIPELRKLYKELKNEVTVFKDNLDNLTTRMEGIMKSMAELGTLVDQVSKNVLVKTEYALYFPIQTQSELDALEEIITEKNKNDMITTVYDILKNGGVEKNINNIFSTNLILGYNLDDIQNKKSLLKYRMLMSVLFGAAQCGGISENMFLKSLKRGFKKAKNRHFEEGLL